jgi:1-aminocyclopropane-1-carboxylate deaminase/D-cysteine desulfhydrase-like pyridoxal-dependent ACC family enzyme
MVDKVALANLPTPLEPLDRLTENWGGPRIWVKRDDLTGFGLSGNKVRKLEYHAAAALTAGAKVLITTGAAQSNHCRATAFTAARLGLACHLVLRTPDGEPVANPTGNHLLHHLSGAQLHFVPPAEYRERDRVMADLAAELTSDNAEAWVIPEGASDYLGMLGFAEAGRELADQIEGWRKPPAVWHASSSGGTTAGLDMAAVQTRHAFVVMGTSVGDTVEERNERLAAIWLETGRHRSLPKDMRPPILTDAYVGGGYGVVSDAELACQLEATRLTGLLFDPVYTGKAIYALREEIRRGGLDAFEDVVFWHTGGGFGVFAHDFSEVLG